MPSLSMGVVTLDPSNPAMVHAGTGNGHDPGLKFSTGVGVYRSADGGGTWTALHRDLFTAAMIGALAWAALSSGMPAVSVTSLAFDATTLTLLAGTYGRGAYVLVLASPTVPPGRALGAGAPVPGRPGPLVGAAFAGAAAVEIALVLLAWVWRRRRAR
jgi:hypothetical protein